MNPLIEDTIEREKVARQNADEIGRLMARYNLIIAARDFPKWRPTKRSSGDIVGIRGELTLIATDGVLGYFLTADDEIFVGHIQRFTGKVEPMFSVPKPPAPDRGCKPGRNGVVSISKRRKELLESL